MTLNEVLIVGTIVVAISLGYILYRQNKAKKDDKN